MGEFIHKAQFLAKQKGITFREACALLAKKSARKRREKRRGMSEEERAEEARRYLERRGLW